MADREARERGEEPKRKEPEKRFAYDEWQEEEKKPAVPRWTPRCIVHVLRSLRPTAPAINVALRTQAIQRGKSTVGLSKLDYLRRLS